MSRAVSLAYGMAWNVSPPAPESPLLIFAPLVSLLLGGIGGRRDALMGGFMTFLS